MDDALRLLRGTGTEQRQFPCLLVDDGLSSLAAGAAEEEARFSAGLSRTLDGRPPGRAKSKGAARTVGSGLAPTSRGGAAHHAGDAGKANLVRDCGGAG